jgi:hypothetical protein
LDAVHFQILYQLKVREGVQSSERVVLKHS